MEERVTFREWCINRGVPFREDPDELGNILVRDTDLIPFYEELSLDFPKYFCKEEDKAEIPHSANPSG